MALVIVHLDSLDNYERMDREEAMLYAERLCDAIQSGGPIYLVSQGWDRPGRARREVLGAIHDHGGARFIEFDEAVSPWGPFLAALHRQLKKDRIKNVTVAGLWYDHLGMSGCATEVIKYLSTRMKVTIDTDLLVEYPEDDNDESDDE